MTVGYRQLAAELRAAIESGVYPTNSKLPTEHELAAQHEVSRLTVRRALDLLKTEGLLVAATSRGTRVAGPPVRLALTRYSTVVDPVRDLPGLGPWETACARQDHVGHTEVVAVNRVLAAADLACRLDIDPGTELIHRSRLMWLDDQVSQIQDSWMPVELVTDTPLASADKVVGGVYAAMQAAGIIPTTLTEEVTARAATNDEMERLQVKVNTSTIVFEIWRTTHDQHGRAVEALRVVGMSRHITLVYDNLRIHPPAD